MGAFVVKSSAVLLSIPKFRDAWLIPQVRDSEIPHCGKRQNVMHHNKIQKRNKMFNHKKSKV